MGTEEWEAVSPYSRWFYILTLVYSEIRKVLNLLCWRCDLPRSQRCWRGPPPLTRWRSSWPWARWQWIWFLWSGFLCRYCFLCNNPGPGSTPKPIRGKPDFSSSHQCGESGSPLTAMPNLVMPCLSHSAMTDSLKDSSWDSPSVTTTITLAAPGRLPLFWWKPHWLTGENRQMSQPVNTKETRGHTRAEGVTQQTNLAYWMAWKVFVECPYICVILDAAFSMSSLVLYSFSLNSNLGLTAYWMTLTWCEEKCKISHHKDQRRTSGALAALTCVFWGPMSREGINFWMKAVIGSQG